MWMCAVFALLTLGYAANAFLGLATIADPAEKDAAIGYVWFWTFLGSIAVLFGVLSWRMTRGEAGGPD